MGDHGKPRLLLSHLVNKSMSTMKFEVVVGADKFEPTI